MALTRKEVDHVAMLARLKLTEEEKERFGEQLGAILNYMEVLDQLDTRDVEPLAHVLPLSNVFREDRARHQVAREEILANAPLEENGQFKVPKII